MQRKSSSSVKIFYPEFSREEIVAALRRMVIALDKRLPLKLALLFGSYAAGTFTVCSDVDVLIVYEGEENKKAYALAKNILDVPHIEPHVYSESQYRKMRKVIDQMAKNGTILSGAMAL